MPLSHCWKTKGHLLQIPVTRKESLGSSPNSEKGRGTINVEHLMNCHHFGPLLLLGCYRVIKLLFNVGKITSAGETAIRLLVSLGVFFGSRAPKEFQLAGIQRFSTAGHEGLFGALPAVLLGVLVNKGMGGPCP